jgi:hypothetical protein
MKDVNIFGDMTLGNLLQDIYVGTMQKRNRINKIITLLESMLSNIDDLAVIGPILNQTLDVLVKNDDHLIKVATIVQRIISAEAYNSGADDLEGILSEAEKDRLVAEAKADRENQAAVAISELKNEVKALDKQLEALPIKLDVKKNG